jgi:hypothetical protein
MCFVASPGRLGLSGAGLWRSMKPCVTVFPNVIERFPYPWVLTAANWHIFFPGTRIGVAFWDLFLTLDPYHMPPRKLNGKLNYSVQPQVAS